MKRQRGRPRGLAHESDDMTIIDHADYLFEFGYAPSPYAALKLAIIEKSESLQFRIFDVEGKARRLYQEITRFIPKRNYQFTPRAQWSALRYDQRLYFYRHLVMISDNPKMAKRKRRLNSHYEMERDRQ